MNNLKPLTRTLAILLLPILLGMVALNIRLYYQPRFVTIGDSQLNKGLLNQLAYLKGRLHGGAASDMQQVYPEGFVFLNALYGLTWIEVAGQLPPGGELYREATEEIEWTWSELSSDEAKGPFEKGLAPPYGIFYRGWTNYVLGRTLKLLPEERRDTLKVDQFRRNCGEIVAAWKDGGSPFPESYSQGCWPADMAVGMASVAIGEDLFPGTFAEDIREWLSQVESKTDKWGLIPHSCDCASGEALETARGSSQSLILHFLTEIDAVYGRQKFHTYKENFLTYRLGLPGIREYPKGFSGNGDIDSGPVVWGVGAAASIVGQRTMATYGETATAIGIRNSLEAFGFGKSFHGKKNYLFGALPIADAFIAWSNSTEAVEKQRLKTQKIWWVIPQTMLLLLLVAGSLAAFRLFKRKN